MSTSTFERNATIAEMAVEMDRRGAVIERLEAERDHWQRQAKAAEKTAALFQSDNAPLSKTIAEQRVRAEAAERERDEARAALARLTKIDDERHAEHVAQMNRRVKVEDALFNFIRETKQGKRGPFTVEGARALALALGVPEDVRVHYVGRAEKAEAALAGAREAALREALDAQPSTAENPNENAYQRGRFDGIMEYGRAILALIPASPAPVDLSGPDGVADGAPWWADQDREEGDE